MSYSRLALYMALTSGLLVSCQLRAAEQEPIQVIKPALSD